MKPAAIMARIVEAEGGNAFSITIASGHNVPGIPNEQVISIKPLMIESV